MTAAGRPWDIAIIGMACRFPGASTPGAFWDNLVRGLESVTFFSDEELLAAGEEATLLRHPRYVKASPILEAHDQFDEAFFGYSPREARLMDPQQRLFLEVAWEAFEDAGYDPVGEKGRVGVYAGAGGLVSSYVVRLDHPELRGQTGDLGHIGNDRDFLCSRVSFKLNLTGPSVNVQSACSTSLLAVHLACRALVDGEADMALAGASVVRVPHVRGYLAEPGNIYSVDGHCRAFDAGASGTLFGSGVAAVLLKPLAAALADGDRVYAVVKGSAVNNDGGQKVNYTASTATGQSRAVIEAMAIAGVGGDDIDFVECHGTATALGDPLEIQALTRAFRAKTSRVGFCAIGSVKSNVGHLEQCAGMAGLVKAVLALQHAIVPPSLHFQTPNPRILFDRSPFEVATSPRPLDRNGRPRRAGVNSVGMGGTNAFVVLEEAPPAPARPPRARPLCLLTVSAPSPEALTAQVTSLRAALAAAPPPTLPDVCFTSNRGRHHFGRRFAAVGGDGPEMLAALDRFGDATSAPTGAARGASPEPVVFLFPGQGSQYPRMGEAIYRAEPVFRDALDRCWALFAAEGIPVADAVLADDAGRLQQTLYAQAALVSLQIALAQLWKHWGVSPGAVIGHSVGEFAAAVAAAVCSVEEAVRLVAGRARLMETLSERGAMLAVAGDAALLQDVWPPDRSDLAIAAVNAPDRHVISGGASAVAIVAERLRRRGVSAAALNTSHAFHSPLMDPMLGAFETLVASMRFAEPTLPWISTLTGQAVAGAPDSRYWRDQIRSPVRFRAAIETAARSGALFLEVGPGATLVSLGRRCVKADAPDAAVAWAASLAGEPGEWSSLLDAVRELYVRGHTIRWEAFEAPGGRRVGLPTYAFRRRRWWLESRHVEAAPTPVTARHVTGHHPLLGERLGEGGLRFETLLDLGRHAFLADHRVFGRVVLPTTAVLELVVAAAERVLGFSRPVVTDFVYEVALVVPDDRPVWLHLALEPREGRATFRVESTGIDAGDPWQVNVTGTVHQDADGVALPPFPSDAVRSDIGEVPAARLYRLLAARGLSYGRAFQGIARLWRHGDEAFARVVLPDELSSSDYAVHPAFLDACLHVYTALPRQHGRLDREDAPAGRVYVPISVDAFHLLRSGVRSAWVHASVVERDAEDEARLRLDIAVYADDGRPAAVFRGVTIRDTSDETLGASPERALAQRLYGVTWRDAGRPESTAALAKHWCILADSAGTGDRLATLLSAEGCTVDVITTRTPAAGLATGLDLIEGDAFEALLGHAPAGSVGVVYLWALDLSVSTAVDLGPPPQTDVLAGGACVGLLKALDRWPSRGGARPRLWLVTRGAQAVGTDPAHGGLAQSPLWGLGRTAALEAPDLWGGLIDLPPDIGPGEAAQLLLGELKSGRGEDQIVLRGDQRLAARFVRRISPALSPRCQLKRDASYWIVGGLGRVGLKTAEALVSAGARHLVLSGRHAPGPESGASLESLRSRAEVVVRTADVASQSDVEAVLGHIRGHMPPLKGVIHAAAVFDDAVLVKLRWEQWRRVSVPKVTGAWVLSHATRDVELDFFVLFSSVLSVWGGLGQGAYTAANSFLDALAEFRRGMGLPATVFNWGPWADVGLAERWGPASTALWTQRGTSTLPPDVYADVLLRFLAGDAPRIVACDTRWEAFVAQFPQTPSLFRDIDVARPANRGVETRDGPEAPVDVVRRHVGHVLGLDDTVSLTQRLNELGLDSLLAVNLANRLRDALKVSVPTAMLLKGPTIAGLVAELFPDEPMPAATSDDRGTAAARVAGDGWLVFHRPNPAANTRLFCFPFAGGGAATFRAWTQHLDPRIELVAIEPPGRQTRIEEPPIRDLATFVGRLVDGLRPFLDRPFAVYGHCLGALTLFETVNALIGHGLAPPVHVFVSGARAPDELHRLQDFETRLLERLVKLPGYNVFEPIHRQPDEVFAEAIRQFNVVATEDLLNDAELRRLILPVIRADFEMSSGYRYTRREPWDIPITCLTGTHDAYVSPANARAWSRFTRRRLQLFMVETEHFLVVDDTEFVIQVLNRELGSSG